MSITDDSPTTMREFHMIRELRATVGLFDGALPTSPKAAWAAWDEAIRRVARLQRLYERMFGALGEADL